MVLPEITFIMGFAFYNYISVTSWDIGAVESPQGYCKSELDSYEFRTLDRIYRASHWPYSLGMVYLGFK